MRLKSRCVCHTLGHEAKVGSNVVFHLNASETNGNEQTLRLLGHKNATLLLDKRQTWQSIFLFQQSVGLMTNHLDTLLNVSNTALFGDLREEAVFTPKTTGIKEISNVSLHTHMHTL